MNRLDLQQFGGRGSSSGGGSGGGNANTNGAKTVTDALYNLQSAQTRSTSQFADWAFSAVNWYVSTGRASPEWGKALMRADPDGLMGYMTSSRDRSQDAYVRRATSYLRRNAGLK